MIHPSNNELNLDQEMSNAAEPQSDRELLLSLNHKVESIQIIWDGKIDELTKSINRLTDAYTKEVKQEISDLRDRIEKTEKWQTEANGGWKTFTIVSSIVAFIALIKAFFK
jgi:archaellum component FlaC